MQSDDANHTMKSSLKALIFHFTLLKLELAGLQ
jgi:hypothetical protein